MTQTRDSDRKSLSASFLVKLFISHESRRLLFTSLSVLEVSTKSNLPPEKHDTQRQSNGRTAFNCRQRAAILVSFSAFFSWLFKGVDSFVSKSFTCRLNSPACWKARSNKCVYLMCTCVQVSVCPCVCVWGGAKPQRQSVPKITTFGQKLRLT